MRPLPDAAMLEPDALARRWFEYALCGVLAIILLSTVLISTPTGPHAASNEPSKVGKVSPSFR